MARTPAFFADCLRASPLHSVMKTQKAKSKIAGWHKKFVRIFLIQNVLLAIHTITISSRPRPIQNGLKYDIPDWFWCMCEFRLCQVMWPQNSVIYIHVCITCVYITIILYTCGQTALCQFFWRSECPNSSNKQILDANGIVLTLRAWQRSNSIICQHKDRSVKSNEVKLLEMRWNDMRWYQMHGLFTKMIGVPVSMWQRPAYATNEEYLVISYLFIFGLSTIWRGE